MSPLDPIESVSWGNVLPWLPSLLPRKWSRVGWLPRWKLWDANLQAQPCKHGVRFQPFRWRKFKACANCGSVSCRPARSAALPQLGTFLSKQQDPAQQVNNWVSFFYYHHQSSILFWQEVAACLAPNPLTAISFSHTWWKLRSPFLHFVAFIKKH